MSVQAWQPWAASSSGSGAWLCCRPASSASTSSGSAAPAIAAASSTPLPRGRLSSSASPGCRGPLGQGSPTRTGPCTVSASECPAPSRASRVWPPISRAPRGSSTERTPARLCTRSSSCSAGAAWGTVTSACTLSTRAPQAHRSLQACRVVRRALSQGSSTTAGKPSMLCSSSAPLALRPSGTASSAAGAGSPGSSRARAAASGAAASLAAQPRQAIAAPGGGGGAASGPAAAVPSRSMKLRSMRSFQRPSQRLGPTAKGPHRASAANPGRCSWGGARPAVPPSASSCSAQRWGRQRRSGAPGSFSRRRRFSASTGAARTAHTPEGGRGSEWIRPQSPLTNSSWWPQTVRSASLSTRPLLGSTGRPAAASQPGAWLPVQSRSAGACGGTCRSIATPARCSNRSPARLAAADPR